MIAPAPPEFDDWQGLLALILDSFRYMEGRVDPPSLATRLTPAALADRASREHLYLATNDNALVGCAFFDERPDALYIGKLAISPLYQGKGLGRAFVATAETLARHLGLPCLRLETRIELVENHRAFAALGFAKMAETAHPSFDRITSITLEKRLW